MESLLGNFKGVMLCNRPSAANLNSNASPYAQQAAGSNNGTKQAAFVVGISHDHSYTGLQPTNETVKYINRKQRKDPLKDVTYRHKQWLKTFSTQRLAEFTSTQQQDAEKQQQMLEFRQKCETMRRTLKAYKQKTRQLDAAAEEAEKENDDDATDAYDNSELEEAEQTLQQQRQDIESTAATLQRQHKAHAEEEKHQDDGAFTIAEEPTQPQSSAHAYDIISPTNNNHNSTQSSFAIVTSNNAKSIAPNKPVWALTEAERDAREDAEADELLNFAGSLNFESYINDIEVSNALQFVKDRVAQLERQAIEQAKQAEKAERAAALRAHSVAAGVAYDSVNVGDNPFDEAALAATQAAHQATLNELYTQRSKQSELENRLASMAGGINRNVHSSASIRALVEQEKQKLHATSGLSSIGEESDDANATESIRRTVVLPVTLSAAPQPLIVTHDIKDSEAIIRKKTVNPSNLPYLYRHPAV